MVLKLDTWLGYEKQCERFILITHSLKMLSYVFTNMLCPYQLFICTTQTSASCISADLNIIKVNHEIKTTVDRCLSHNFNWFEWYVSTITVILPPLAVFPKAHVPALSPLLYLLISLFVFCVHPLRPQLAFAYLIKLCWGFKKRR